MSGPESKTGQEMWGGRFDEPTDTFVQRFTASEAFDRRLAACDIQGSRAHANMLQKTGVLTQDEKEMIRWRLIFACTCVTKSITPVAKYRDFRPL